MVYILVLTGVLGILLTLRFLWNRINALIKERQEKKEFKIDPLFSEDNTIKNALSRLNYFKKLSPQGKEKFIFRAKKILKRLSFSTAGNIVADDEKKVLIIASIVQITFGLEDYDIDTIDSIKIFENNIYNPKTKVQYKGLTFMNGNMYLSWEHFLEGIRLQDDGINLGLHETGHGLYILLKQNSEYEDFDDILSAWYAEAQKEIDHKNLGKEGFFRKYADANKEEFFAICIENFFERPAEFEKRLPLIYKQLCVFLNQNPINSSTDYIAENSVAVNPVERFYLHKNRWHPSYTLFVFFSYLSIVVFLVIKQRFMETFLNFVIFSVPCIILSYFLFKKFYLDSKRLSKRIYLLLCTAAISPILVVSLLILNLLVPVSPMKTVKYITVGYSNEAAFSFSQEDFTILDRGQDIYKLKDNYTVPIELRKASAYPHKSREIEYTYHYGLMGLKVLDSMQEKALE